MPSAAYLRGDGLVDALNKSDLQRTVLPFASNLTANCLRLLAQTRNGHTLASGHVSSSASLPSDSVEESTPVLSVPNVAGGICGADWDTVLCLTIDHAVLNTDVTQYLGRFCVFSSSATDVGAGGVDVSPFVDGLDERAIRSHSHVVLSNACAVTVAALLAARIAEQEMQIARAGCGETILPVISWRPSIVTVAVPGDCVAASLRAIFNAAPTPTFATITTLRVTPPKATGVFSLDAFRAISRFAQLRSLFITGISYITHEEVGCLRSMPSLELLSFDGPFLCRVAELREDPARHDLFSGFEHLTDITAPMQFLCGMLFQGTKQETEENRVVANDSLQSEAWREHPSATPCTLKSIAFRNATALTSLEKMICLPALTSLDLFGSCIGDEAVVILRDSFKRLLRSLCCALCLCISREGFIPLGDMVALEHLDTHMTAIGGEAFDKVCHLPRLQSLNCSTCSALSSEDFKSLRNAKNLTSLTAHQTAFVPGSESGALVKQQAVHRSDSTAPAFLSRRAVEFLVRR